MSEDNNQSHPIYKPPFPYNFEALNVPKPNEMFNWIKPYIPHKPFQTPLFSPLHPFLPSLSHSSLPNFKKYLYYPWLMNLDSPQFNRKLQGIQDFQYQANNPTEDRLVIKELSNKQGYLLGVFDGHGGGALAQQGSKRIHGLFEKYYEELKKKDSGDKKEAMKQALILAFDSLEQTFYEKAQEELMEKKKYKKIGSCVICCVLTKEFVIVANAGDSKCILVSQETGETVELNEMFNTNNQKQIKRLISEHEDEDILIANTKNGAKYLKGCLIPTRCFGDFHLKHKQFAEGVIKFNGKPYITSTPDIKEFEFKNNNKYYLVLGSDGLWDELNDEEISKTMLVSEDLNKADALIDAALERVAEKHETSVERIKDLSPKRKRDYHDDISVIVANLEQLC